MKNIFLFIALFFTLVVQTASAQRTLPPSLRPYAVNWTYTLVKNMHRAGYDMPTMRALPDFGNAVTARNTLQLDSTKTFYGYHLNGSNDSFPLFRSTYEYPAPDVKIETNYQYDVDQWFALNRSTIVSDDRDRIVDVTAEAFDAATGTYVPDSRLEIFPHDDSPELVDSVLTYAWQPDAETWVRIFAIKNVFDDEDRLLESISQADYFGAPLIFRDVYLYDANGDNNRIEAYADFGGQEVLSGVTEITYVDHQPLEATVYVSDGVNLYPQSRANYAYTLFGALRKRMDFEWNEAGENWRRIQTTDYTYDNAQRIGSKETTFHHQDAADEREMILYVYIDGEDLALETVLIWNEDLFDWKLDSRKYFYYNGLVSVDPSPRPALALKMAPNPTTGPLQFLLDEEASIRVFDAAGLMVDARILQPGQQLDLTALPAGIYTVTALKGKELYTGQVVKQ